MRTSALKSIGHASRHDIAWFANGNATRRIDRPSVVFDQLGEPHDVRKALTVLLHQGIGIAQKQSSADHSNGYRRVRDALPKEKRYGICVQQKRDAHWVQGSSNPSQASIECGEFREHWVAHTASHVCIALNRERCAGASSSIAAWPCINLDHDEVLACRTV